MKIAVPTGHIFVGIVDGGSVDGRGPQYTWTDVVEERKEYESDLYRGGGNILAEGESFHHKNTIAIGSSNGICDYYQRISAVTITCRGGRAEIVGDASRVRIN